MQYWFQRKRQKIEKLTDRHQIVEKAHHIVCGQVN